MADLTIDTGGVKLAVVDSGKGIPVLLLHGLTATHRYVVMGSTALERSGHRVVAYDSRGHGRSSPAADASAYRYSDLAADAVAVIDALEIERAVFAGSSMGAHTLLRVALESPERVGGLVVITPSYDPVNNDDPERLTGWDSLAAGLRSGGIEGFIRAYDIDSVPAAWRETVLKVIRQRLAQHEHLDAVADGLEAVPRSRPFGELTELGSIAAPAAVVASDDEADPGHPRRVGEAYAAAIPGARLVLDQPGRSPVAWQGSQLSKVIADVAAEAASEARFG